MADAAPAAPCQVVDKDGVLQTPSLQDLLRARGVDTCGPHYAVVAIMGPQSSGKSTLLNHVFGTGFREMDASAGRSQTTQGIWLSVSPKLKDFRTLVLDLEGSDGRERGEDDTTFERQSALFALAVSDVLMINLWHHDIGREHGSGKPLLKTVLQENLKLFDSGKRKTLLFVIRDRSSKTPLDKLVTTLREDLERIWASILETAHGPPNRRLDDVFDLNFTSLPNYEEKEEEFEAEATLLRSRFKRTSEDCYIPGETSVPGSALCMSVERIWKVIRENKNLDLPAHRVMVATVRCDQAILDLGSDFAANTQVRELQEAAAIGLTANFGKMCEGVLEEYLCKFDAQVEFFEPSVCAAKREEMHGKLMGVLSVAVSAQFEFCRTEAMAAFALKMGGVTGEGFESATGELRAETLASFDAGVREACVSDELPREAKDARARLCEEMDAMHDATVKTLTQTALSAVQKGLFKALSAPLASLLEDLPPDTWQSARSLKAKQLEEKGAKLEAQLAGLGLSEQALGSCMDALSSYCDETCCNLIEEAAHLAGSRIKGRFTKAFCYDAKGTPRVWNAKADVPAVVAAAKQVAANALRLLTVSRLFRDYDAEFSQGSDISNAIDALAESTPGEAMAPGLASMFTSSTWEGVEEDDVLLSPIACKSAWRQMESEISYTVSQALAAQEAARQASQRGPPLWALLAIGVLGWNEFIALLYNPVLLVLLILLFVFGRAVYTRIDIAAELEKGFIPALISISLKLTPILVEVAGQFAGQIKDALEQHQGQQGAVDASPDGSGGGGGGGGQEQEKKTTKGSKKDD